MGKAVYTSLHCYMKSTYKLNFEGPSHELIFSPQGTQITTNKILFDTINPLKKK